MKALALIIVFLIPTQLALHFWPLSAFIFGIRVDYLSPAIYLTDILIAILILSDISSLKKYFKYLVPILLLALINLAFSTSFYVSLYKWLKIIEYALFAFYIAVHKEKIGESNIFKTLFYSLVFFSLIGIAQFILGQTINGTFYYLGERMFTKSTPGIALVTLFGRFFLRAYSTFPHPNALAGFIGASLLLLKGRKINRAGLYIILLGFALTFSLTALVGLIVTLLIDKFSRKSVKPVFFAAILFSLLLPIFANFNLPNLLLTKNVSERLTLALIAGTMISQKFLVGEGLNTFVINSTSWLLQPVHNIFLLAFSETGIVGLLTLIYFFYKSLNKKYFLVILFIVITGVADHYWITIQQNSLLIALISGLAL